MNQKNLFGIVECGPGVIEDWIALRRMLWPHCSEQEHHFEAAALLRRSGQAAAFLARPRGQAAIGFAEATLRYDYVNGCTSSPVAFLEGIYVKRNGGGMAPPLRLT